MLHEIISHFHFDISCSQILHEIISHFQKMNIIKESSMPSFRISTPSCSVLAEDAAYVSTRQHTPAYASIRQHTPAYVSRGFAGSPGHTRNRDRP
jgi:hypothetical protein